MGLTARLVSAAVLRPHVLLVPVPGARDVRAAAQRSLDDLGWRTAAVPADADVLLVCGEAGPALRAAADAAWDVMPGPRVRVEARRPGEVQAALLRARVRLADRPWQVRDAAARPAPPLGAGSGHNDTGDAPVTGHDMRGDQGHGHGADRAGSEDPAAEDGEGHRDAPDDAPDDDMGGMDMGGMDMGGMDMGGMDMGGMDMGGMDMDLPGGLTMADRADDRDGLKLDVLHVVLGPVLGGWPTGLRLTAVLQGDVLASADAELLDPRPEPPAPREWQALDELSALVGAAGWADGAVLVRRARDGRLPVAEAVGRVRRARLLRWSLRGLPAPGGEDLVAHLGLLLDVCSGASARRPTTEPDELARAVTGLDLGSAALVASAFGPRLRAPAAARG